MSTRPSQPSQREWARIDTHLAVRFKKIGSDEHAAFEERVIGGDIGQDELPLALVAYLRNIEYKLDLVLSKLDPSFEAPLDPRAQSAVVVSAGGIHIAGASADVKVGDEVWVEMLLPGDAPRTVHALGHVSRIVTSTQDGIPGIAIEYDSIDEGDRDAIVRLVNRLQLAAGGRRPREAP
jgi:hypothetical protein